MPIMIENGNNMNLELCTDSVAGAKIASKYNFKRIELCSALSVGGLTPSLGLIEQCVRNSTAEVHCMLRHREGDFAYSPSEVKILEKDLKDIAKTGAKGVVWGILDEKNGISESNKHLVDLAKSLGLQATFHRAFDFVTNPLSSIKTLVAFGFDRVLTSGQQPKAIMGIDVIADLQKNNGSQIAIMAGSGVNASNVKEFVKIGIENLHFTSHKIVEDPNLGMGVRTIVDENKIEMILKQL